jgi:hypothetical protein
MSLEKMKTVYYKCKLYLKFAAINWPAFFIFSKKSKSMHIMAHGLKIEPHGFSFTKNYSFLRLVL